MKTKLNIGSGFRPKTDYVNLDIDIRTYPDVLRDIRKGLPFDDNRFEEIYTSHVMEHLEWEDFYFVMREFWRVLNPKGKLIIIVPYYKHPYSAFDIDHKIVITDRALNCFMKGYGSVSGIGRHVTQGYAYFNIEVVEEPKLPIKEKGDVEMKVIMIPVKWKFQKFVKNVQMLYFLIMINVGYIGKEKRGVYQKNG